MSSFSEALAHPDDPLSEHLTAVAEDAATSLEGAPDRVRRAALLMGFLHDAGKATPWFQRYLEGEESQSEHTSHALLGAVLAHRILDHAREANQVSPWTHWTVVVGIDRHHGNFDDGLERTMGRLVDRAHESDALRDQLEALDSAGLRAWVRERFEDHQLSIDVPSLDAESVLESVGSFFPRIDGLPFDCAEDGFDVLAAFGAFVGADKMHTAHPERERESPDIPDDLVDAYKRAEFGEPEDELDQWREEVSQEVQQTLEEASGDWIYTLTAPTGSGKTLTGLEAALQLKRRKERAGGRSRLVYCLPFTSVIDQNARVYENVFLESGIDPDDRVLLKHHHLADPRYDDGGDPIIDGGELLVETWQSDIVVTTFHQLLHTVFTSKNKNLKRISALRDAVVVLDEVQAIDHDYWDDVRRMMALCADRLRTTFVLMTATMPLIVGPDEGPELLESHRQRYEQFARTQLVPRLDTALTVEDLAEEIEADVGMEDEPRRRIVLVNRRDTARRLYRRLEELPIPTAMLSTDLTPLHRERVLEGLGDEFLLVSTQVIEAGVDISSDVLIREIAPLDSIVQSAGRCNREFELHPHKGEVQVVRLEEDGASLAVPPYSSFLIESTVEVLDQLGQDATIDEARFHEMAQRYYEIVQQRSSSASVIDHLVEGTLHKLDDGSEGFRLIEDRPEQSHFIIRTEKDREIWQTYLDIQNMEIRNRDDFIEKKEWFQEIKRAFSMRLVNYPTRERPTEEVIPVEPDSDAYDPNTGLRRNVAEASFAFI